MSTLRQSVVLKPLSYSIIVLGIGLLWQYAGDRMLSVRILIGTPRRLLAYVVDERAKLLLDTATTGFESACGLLLAVVISALIMVACLYFPRALNASLSLAVWTQVIPLVTLAPILILVFGFGLPAKVATAALLAFFPAFIALARGTAAIDYGTRDLLRVYAASRTVTIFRVIIPLSLPYFMTGVRVSSTLAVIGAIVGEFNGALQGLGYNLLLASHRIAPELTMSSIMLSAGVSAVLYFAVVTSERFLMPWHRTTHEQWGA